MKVEYIDHMGSDLDVCNAARVSFAKESFWGGAKLAVDDEGNTTVTGNLLYSKDQKLIKYLAKHNHWSPFSHCYIKFRILAPVFVARQLAKHQVGLAWNEVSRRYVDFTPELYNPEEWRASAESVKQGSSDVAVVLPQELEESLERTLGESILNYEKLLKEGVCAEQARMVLPQNMMTEWIWSGSLAAFARVVNLRSAEDSQKETREISDQIKTYLEQYFPVSTEALLTYSS